MSSSFAPFPPCLLVVTSDSHLHVWGDGKDPFPYAEGQAPPERLQLTSSSSVLLQEMDNAGVGGALIVQVECMTSLHLLRGTLLQGRVFMSVSRLQYMLCSVTHQILFEHCGPFSVHNIGVGLLFELVLRYGPIVV